MDLEVRDYQTIIDAVRYYIDKKELLKTNIVCISTHMKLFVELIPRLS